MSEDTERDPVDVVFEEFWSPILVDDQGDIDLDQVKKELFDFWQVMQEVPKVYCHITGNQVSKILTKSEVVISLADDSYAKCAKDNALDIVKAIAEEEPMIYFMDGNQMTAKEAWKTCLKYVIEKLEA